MSLKPSGSRPYTQSRSRSRAQGTDGANRARHAEVARRYARHSRETRKAVSFRLVNLRTAEVKRILRARGYDKERVVDTMAALGDLQRWSAGELGDHMVLTLEERTRLGIRTIQCCDRTKKEVAAFNRMRKQQRDRERRRAKREEARMLLEPKETRAAARAKALLTAIEPEEWVSVPALCSRTANSPAFRKLGPASRPRAVRRALDALAKQRIVDLKRDDGAAGLPAISVKLHRTDKRTNDVAPPNDCKRTNGQTDKRGRSTERPA